MIAYVLLQHVSISVFHLQSVTPSFSTAFLSFHHPSFPLSLPPPPTTLSPSLPPFLPSLFSSTLCPFLPPSVHFSVHPLLLPYHLPLISFLLPIIPLHPATFPLSFPFLLFFCCPSLPHYTSLPSRLLSVLSSVYRYTSTLLLLLSFLPPCTHPSLLHLTLHPSALPS